MKRPNPILHRLFTLYAWTIAFVFLSLHFAISTCCLIVFGYVRSYPIYRTFRFVMWMLFSPVEVSYHPDFQHDQPYVLVQNHINLLDAFIVAAVSKNPLCGLMHSWQFRIPFYGWIMRLSKGIAVDPSRRDNLEQMNLQARQRKEKGISILTFPEGGRTRTQEMKPMKKGAFVMARQAGYQIVPVAVAGNHFINQKGSFLMWPHRVKVHVGKPRLVPDLERDEMDLWVADVRRQMQTWIERQT